MITEDLYKKIKEGKFLVSGPCVLEDEKTLYKIAEEIKELSIKYDFTYVFKASFDKANRTSVNSYRGIGLEKGLEVLNKLKQKFDLPITTDIHESYQADLVKDVVDIIQIPAFLCRQTDLLIEAGKTGKIVNIKKAQFLSANQMKYPVEKVFSTDNQKVIITERGSMFGFQNLVVDYTGILDMFNLGCPVMLDATHSVQKPGVGSVTAGNREYAPYLAYAAAIIGVKGFFFEVHPDPTIAKSDGPNSIYLSNFPDILKNISNIIEFQKEKINKN